MTVFNSMEERTVLIIVSVMLVGNAHGYKGGSFRLWSFILLTDGVQINIQIIPPHYAGGAPLGVCSSMKPFHMVAAQSVPSPYMLSVDAKSIQSPSLPSLSKANHTHRSMSTSCINSQFVFFCFVTESWDLHNFILFSYLDISDWKGCFRRIFYRSQIRF